MRARRLRAKYPGRCRECGAPVRVGQAVYWYGRGQLEHVDCESARLLEGLCTACCGRGMHWTGPCGPCRATGDRDVQTKRREPTEAERDKYNEIRARFRLPIESEVLS